MHTTPVGIIGASGYSGVESTRILALHPRVEVRFLSSHRWQGDSVAKRLGIAGAIGELKYAPLEQSETLSRDCGAVFLATPADVSLRLVPKLLRDGLCVIDLSGAFRLKDPSDYPTYYGFTHPTPALLERAAYGLPELFRGSLRKAPLIANPGCYATAAALAVAPLLRQGLLDDRSIIFNAASGTTGAGRKESEELSFSEVNEDFRAYRILRHQHTPEISLSLGRYTGRTVPFAFVTHLLPVKRGILCTTYARVRQGEAPSRVADALKAAYADEPFVTWTASAEEISLKSVVGTNRCLLGAAWDPTGRDEGRMVVFSAIDNLIKGAAGQAVQNLNIAMGWPETEGLLNLRGFYP